MKLERKILSGVMNLDDPNDVIPNTSHRTASNVLFKGNPGQMRLESIPGNQSVSNAGLYTTGGATNTCIGSYYDELKQRLFYFVYNSSGYDAIFVYNTISRSISTLLMSKVNSAANEPLFSFNPDNPITSVNILYRTEEDGDIIMWTDSSNRPMKLNIKEAESNVYAAGWKKSYLTVSRPMPLLSPVCKYIDEGSVANETVNNLKNKVYQFRYRWVYKDFTKSTWSPWSKLFAPVNVDDVANESNPLKNNTISVKYFSGDSDILKIEIAARHSIDTTFTDPFLVETINKAGLFDNNEYEYKFRNTEAYPYLDVTESNALFDYIPLKANAQELLNGNIVIYGGITEGRSPIDSTGASINLSVTNTLSLIQNTDNSSKFTTSLSKEYVFDPNEQDYFAGYYYIIFEGTPAIGDEYNFEFRLKKTSLPDKVVSITKVITASEDTYSELETYLVNTLNANADFISYALSGEVFALNAVDPLKPGKYGIRIGGIPGSVPLMIDSSWVDNINFTVVAYAGGGLPPDPTGVNTACYKHKSRYSFGICYFDEYGVTNGVMTTDNMKITTPEIDSVNLSGVQLTIPSIEFSVSNRPPVWAKYFSFVRTSNLTISDFKTIITTTTYPASSIGYAYLDITEYQLNKTGYPAYSFIKGDRVRIIGRKNQAEVIYDYPILSYTTSAIEKAIVLPADKLWIKIPYESWMSVFNTAGYQNYYIEAYTPSLNTSDSSQIFYEFGETYTTGIDVNGNIVHNGMTQDQVIGIGAKPAKYTFYRGDIYSRKRDGLFILDRAMSDKYGSTISGNGRPFVIDEYAKESYYPTLVRYSLEYQSGTNINQTNRFYAANFDEYDRERGDIQRLKVRGRQLRVFQKRSCGVVPVLQNLVQTADGNGVLSQSSEIINNIQYYLGDYGIGNQSCGLVSSANSDYFTDPIRGCQVRLSNDGITPISEIYKSHFFLNPLVVKYNKVRSNISGIGKAKILGVFDQFNEEYVTVMQESIAGSDKSVPYTFGFNEMRNSYTSFYDFSPEWITTAENLVISWKSGILYTHDNRTDYCRFYGTQYKPSVTVIFNQYEQIKKRYNTITMLASKVWAPNTNGDITTNIGQSSSLQASDFIFKDDKIHAAFKRDSGSTGGLYNGNVLKGNWAQIKLQPVNGNEFVNLYYLELSILEPFYNR